MEFTSVRKAANNHTNNNYSEKILVVEDDKEFQGMICDFLASQNYDYSSADDGKAAIRIVQEDTIAIILTDMEMPDISGMDLLRYVKKEAPTVDVIVMTGHSKTYSFMDVINEGASDFLVKPFLRDELFAKINRVIRERTLIQQQQLEKEKLSKMNDALSILLEKRDQDKMQLQKEILSQVKHLVVPYMNKLKRCGLNGKQKELLRLQEKAIDGIISPFAHSLLGLKMKLTPMEIQIADMVKQGYSSKEIAQFMGLSPNTVNNHRRKIRSKCGLANQSINLRSFLTTLSK